MGYKAVIFDFGGVFTTSPLQNFAAFEKEHGLPGKFIGGVIKANHHENAWARFERSEISLEEFDTLFAKESREAGYEITGATLVSLLRLELYPEMIDALKRVKSKGFKTGCITNNIPKFDNAAMVADVEKASLVKNTLTLFDHVIESSKAGTRKPEPRIYEMMCKALGTPPQDCIFLDDLGINLKPAKAMGMTTIKVPIGDVSPAIKELESLT